MKALYLENEEAFSCLFLLKDAMKRILIAPLLMWVEAAHANQEVTVGLPVGATLQMVWIEPGMFVMGTNEEQEPSLRDKGRWPRHFEVLG